jgi:lipopolysaccharide/colanic/teichoic acid biosynthesis glycosyltransferase
VNRSPLRARTRAAGLHGVVVRLLDVTISAVALVVLAPLMVMIAALIRATSPGPAIFRQARVGHLERSFEILKFRTMYLHCEDTPHREYVTALLMRAEAPQEPVNGLFKLDGDPRLTPLGAFLRRTSLDELPQLYNVLRGEMSLVGPRPALAWEADLYEARHRRRFEVKPGITGLWQVRGRNKLSMREALELDMEYVERRCLALDIWILAMTLPVVFRGQAR